MNEILMWQIISFSLIFFLLYLSFNRTVDLENAYKNGNANCLNDYMWGVLNITNNITKK